MIIGFDISMLVYQGSGVASYTYNLVKHLLLSDNKNEYRLFYSSFRRPDNFYYLDKLKEYGAKVYDYPFPPRILNFCWNKFEIFPIELLIGKVDLFHSSDFLRPPLFKGTTGITTIHDLTWKIYPQFHTADIVRAHERKIQRTIKAGDIIIVDSENTKQDLLRHYPQTKKNNKIYTIYLGVDSRFVPIADSDDIQKVLKKYHIEYPKNYLLYVGAIEPRKNLDITIKVYAELLKDKKFSDFEFLIAGRAGWKNEDIFRLITSLHLEDKIHFVGYVEDNDLPYFYNASRTLVYLSKYEGFGLPPLEALACGTKIIAGNNSSISEIIDKKYLCSENNEKEILEKLKSILATTKKNIIENKFTWDKTAADFLSIVKKIS